MSSANLAWTPTALRQLRKTATVNLADSPVYGGARESRMKFNLALKLSATTRLPDVSMQGTKTAWLGNITPSWTR